MRTIVELPAPFDVCGALPEPGVTVLEASAGTGKTFTIAALTARLVADGVVPLSQILAVTFTRMATGELRDRVRGRLVTAEAGLRAMIDGGKEPDRRDEILCMLAGGSDDEVRARRDRLAEALATFDAATITTTHGFCQLVLAGLGVAGTVATGATLLEDPRDLIDEVVDDLFVRGVLRWGGLSFTRRDAQRVGRAAVANPSTRLIPDPELDRTNKKARLARSVRDEVGRRLRDLNQLTYDDLLVRLAETLTDSPQRDAACTWLRERFKVVLVDEFQDTDPVQWQVVRSAFGSGATRLVLIGDPKQAVYAFRGADVHAYLDAAHLADRRYTLNENWRSDEGLIAAYNLLLDDVHLGHPDIPYRVVSATAEHHRAGMRGAPMAVPLRLRVLHSDDHPDLRITPKRNLVQKTAALEWVADDLAADVVGLLRSGAVLADGDRVLAPGDIAVLVRTNRQAGIIQRSLRASGVPAVVAGTESVFETAAARDWRALLEALEQPADRARAVAVALTAFIGMTAAEVAEAEESRWEDVHERLHRWAEMLRNHGVASLFRAVTASEGLPGRVLAEMEGERELTDLAHVAQLLHAEATSAQLGPPALRAWLARRIDEAGDETADAEERSRRLDSDAAAVQVLTVHRAKGLEFPVVYCPYLFDSGFDPGSGGPVVFHDAEYDWERRLDVGVDPGVADAGGDIAAAARAYDRHYQAHHDEERGEDLRHLYVALTRAKHQCVVWWARVQDCQHSPLGRLLMFRGPDGSVPANGGHVPKDSKVHERLMEWAQHAPDRISVERALGGSGERWDGRPGGTGAPGGGAERVTDPPLELARFDRSLDLRWRRTSYSGITAAAHDEMVGSEPEDPGRQDEPSRPGAAVAPDRDDSSSSSADPISAEPSPWSDLPAGAEFGTFVHGVLERTDFAATDLDVELRRAVAAERAQLPPDPATDEALIAALGATLSTPLGPLAGDARLRDIRRSDRLDELGFELPLCGGDDPQGELLISDVAGVLSETLGSSPLPGYPERLRGDPLLGSHLRGYLNGSLDLVVRRDDRYFVADYKTNWLGSADGELTTWHYRPSALAAEMSRAHYPLQALLYLVALHRYLRWRLPDYDPDRHLGGVLYLFVRGMNGPDVPRVDGQPCGVFGWRPPGVMVTKLSDLMATGTAV